MSQNANLVRLTIYLGYGDRGRIIEKKIRELAAQEKKSLSHFVLSLLKQKLANTP